MSFQIFEESPGVILHRLQRHVEFGSDCRARLGQARPRADALPNARAHVVQTVIDPELDLQEHGLLADGARECLRRWLQVLAENVSHASIRTLRSTASAIARFNS